jgi:hypothetical protein
MDSLPSWQQSFSAPSVVPGDMGLMRNYSPPSNYNFAFSPSGPSSDTSFGFDPSFKLPEGLATYTPPSSYGTQPASSSWLDYAKAGGLALSAAGDAVRAYRGEPTPPGSSPFQNYLAEEEQKEGDERLAKLLKEIGGSSSTDAIEGVLDPAADKRKDPRLFGQLPSLSSLFSSDNTRMAGDLFSKFS